MCTFDITRFIWRHFTCLFACFNREQNTSLWRYPFSLADKFTSKKILILFLPQCGEPIFSTYFLSLQHNPLTEDVWNAIVWCCKGVIVGKTGKCFVLPRFWEMICHLRKYKVQLWYSKYLHKCKWETLGFCQVRYLGILKDSFECCKKWNYAWFHCFWI